MKKPVPKAKKTRMSRPPKNYFPSTSEVMVRIAHLESQLNSRFSELDRQNRHLQSGYDEIKGEMIQLNQRFKPVVFLPQELDQLKVAKTTVWHAQARDDRPFNPFRTGGYEAPKGFPLNWQPPKHPNDAWLPPGYTESKTKK